MIRLIIRSEKKLNWANQQYYKVAKMPTFYETHRSVLRLI
jgi:hypothetical protein